MYIQNFSMLAAPLNALVAFCAKGGKFHWECYDFFLFLTLDRLPSPERPPKPLSMTDRTPTTSSLRILRGYPYRSPRLCLSIRHIILDPPRLRSDSTCRRAVPLIMDYDS